VTTDRHIADRVRDRAQAMGRELRALGADASGLVAILAGLLLPVLAGIGMLGVDAGVWYWERRNLQTAADAAAAGGAWWRYDNGSAGVVGAATRDAKRNGLTGSIDVENPPLTGAGSDDPAAVAVTLAQPLSLFYSRVIGEDSATVRVHSTATIVVEDEFCLLGLDPTMPGAITVRGNADVDLTCGIAVNSESMNALQVTGNAAVNATGIHLVGDVDTNGNPEINSPVRAGQRPVRDPYEDLAVPVLGPCDETNYSGNGAETLDPGTYCGGMSFGSQADVFLNPGVYIVSGGEFRVNAQARLRGDDVTIILTDDATMRINGGADVELVAPTIGTWAGILIYQDRASTPGATNRVNGGANLNLQGAVYFPAQELEFTGNADIGPGCLQVIARQITVSGAGAISNNCDSAGTRPIGLPRLRFLR